MDLLMNDQLSTFEEAISLDSNKSISLPESVAGHMRLNSPDGLTISKFGQDHAHVSRFRALDSEKAMPTSDTSGPLFTASSLSADLQWSLESKLAERMVGNGLPLFALTWKDSDMPSGPQICRVSASGRHISGAER